MFFIIIIFYILKENEMRINKVINIQNTLHKIFYLYTPSKKVDKIRLDSISYFL